MAKNRVHRYMARDFTFRASFVEATEVIQHMRDLQGATPIPTRGLGRTMMGALLMASHLKGDQSVGIYIKGDSPIQSLFAEATVDGQVRAYSPQASIELAADPGMGKGFITVHRDTPFQKSPYNGTVELLTGDVQDDIMFYLRQSQQIRCLIELDVRVGNGGKVIAAAGLLIEVMPGVEDDVFQALARRSQGQPKIVEALLAGKTPDEIVSPYLEDFEFVEIDHDHPIRYTCRCTREKVRTTIAMLGEKDIATILEEEQPIDVRCQICGTPYHFSLHEVSELLGELNKDSLH